MTTFCTTCGYTSASDWAMGSHHCRPSLPDTRRLELGHRADMAELNEEAASRFGPGGLAFLLFQRRCGDVASEVAA